MYKDYRYINAGENEIHRYGKKAQARIKAYLEPNENGFYSIPCDGGKYWTIGTSTGKYGEFARVGDDFISVNSVGFAYAKVGSKKEEVFFKLVNACLDSMIKANEERCRHLEDEEEEQDEY